MGVGVDVGVGVSVGVDVGVGVSVGTDVGVGIQVTSSPVRMATSNSRLEYLGISFILLSSVNYDCGESFDLAVLFYQLELQ